MAVLQKLDWVSIAVLFCFALLGLGALYPYSALNSNGFFLRQLIFFGLGFAFLFSLAFLNISFLKKQRVLIFSLYVIGIVFLILTLLLGRNVRGAVSWLGGVPFLSGTAAFQTSEAMKIIIIFILARYFAFKHVYLSKPINVIISGFYVGIPTALTLFQPDLGSAVVLFLLWLGVVMISGLGVKHFAVILVLIVIAAGILWAYGLEPYQKVRVLSFLNPESDPLGANYSRNQSLIAFGAGGLYGKGFGEATHSLDGFLPEAHTDFIFSMLAEGLGLSGVAILFMLYGVLIWRLFLFEGKGNFDRLFASFLGFLIFIEAGLNIGIALGLLPVTGLALPFLSYGGSSLISHFIGIGIYQALYVRA